jgi:hypothetical protein
MALSGYRGSHSFGLVLAMAVAVHVSRAAAAPPPKPVSMSIGEGAVVSRATSTLYVMDPKDGIVAVDLATNKTKWSSGALAAKPFAEVGDALIGADEKGALRVLDARTGKARARCSTIPGVGLSIQDGLGSHHSSSGASDDKRAWIAWSSSTHYAGGAAPTPEIEARSRTESGGVHEIDVAACTSKPGRNPWAPGKMPKTGDAVYTAPSGIRFRVAAGSLRLERVRAGTPQKPINLKQGKPGRSMFVVTADLRHIIVGELAGNAYPSAIVDVETGAVVATVTLPFFPPAALVIGRRLIMGGGAVFAFDLDAQKVLWTRGLRSTTYNGPYPPSAPP